LLAQLSSRGDSTAALTKGERFDGRVQQHDLDELLVAETPPQRIK
jgi:hypothetical protein